MKYVDLSTGEGIGANCHYIEIGPFKLAIDAGVNPKAVGVQSLPTIEWLPEDLDAILLTHCHLDHLGALPVLLRRYPSKPCFMSMPSMMLARRMLHNSVNVMLRQREEQGRNDLPLYTHGEVEGLGKQIVPMAYGRPRPLERAGEKLEITYYQSGHVAGAAGVLLEWRGKRIFNTGDVLFEKQRHLGGAQFPGGPFDLLITETTRGRNTRKQASTRGEETGRLFQAMNETLLQGGSALIPVFALGRTQEMLCMLHEGRANGTLPECPIFASGLGMDLADYFDEITRKTGLLRFRKSVVKELRIRPLPSDLKPGRNPPEPGIFLLSSGMMVEHTPSYYVAASLLHDPINTLCMIGYCDPDTPGGKLLETAPGEEFRFDVYHYQTPRLARVERFDLSGHADREELVDYARSSEPGTVILTHGDPDAREWFMDALTEALPAAKVINPRQSVPVEIE